MRGDTMLTTLLKTYKLIRFNWKPLIVFEIFYRLFGLVVIYPLANQMFYFSVRITGKEYISNADFYEYLTSPVTILIGFLFLIIFSLYVTYEVIALSILFHYSYFREDIGIQSLFILSLRKFRKSIKQYHIFIMISSMIFLIIVEALHFVGIASTVSIPVAITDELKSHSWFTLFIVVSIISLIVLFFETIYFEIQCTIEQTTPKQIILKSNRLLKNNRIRTVVEFLLVNGIINGIFYLLYLIVIGLLALFIMTFGEEDTAYAFVLTSLYSTYIAIGFLATVILIPFNFSWINVRYYDYNTSVFTKDTFRFKPTSKIRKFTQKKFYRFLVGTTLVLFIISILNITIFTRQPAKIELFNTPSVVSHRGGGFYAPENTLSSIEKGIELGADAIEIDIRFTKDNIPVLIHDSTLTRTTDDTENTKVKDLTLEELKTYDAGSWFSEEFAGEQIPTLVEALEVMSRRVNVYIELKVNKSDAADLILQAIEDSNFQGNVKVISFEENVLIKIKERNKDIETMKLLSSFIGDINILIEKDHIDHYGFRYDIFDNNSEYVELLQEAGKGVYVWTLNDRTSIETMNNLGIDGIITDIPLYTRELIYSDGTKSVYSQLLQKLFVRTPRNVIE